MRPTAVRLRGSLFDIALSFPAARCAQSDAPGCCKKIIKYKKFALLSLSDLLFCCGGAKVVVQLLCCCAIRFVDRQNLAQARPTRFTF